MTETLRETSYCRAETELAIDNQASRLRQTKTKRLDFVRSAVLLNRKTQKEAKDENNNCHDENSNERLCKAATFKHASNAPKNEIEDLRELLLTRRDIQAFDEDTWNFLKSDFDRLMVDDWLVTRFLLRGKKSCDESCTNKAPIGNVQTSNDESKRAIYARTIQLIEICAKFRYEFRINAQTRENEFPLEWTRVNGMFHHRHDRAGNPTAYMRVSLHKPKLIETDQLRHEFKRYMLYVLEQCDQHLFQRPGKAICCVFDMSNVAFENIDLELTTWMIKSFKSSAPKLLCYVIIYNPPWFFTATFKLICSTLLSNNKRQSIKFAYGDEILDYIDLINLPPYLRSGLM